ncbi:MAG: cupin domain-containing protein [Burkholderiales bacterium]|nr:cupin domain-containing protein [Burkholderiales bacterium]MCE7878123.1 cupin domain-containing protein [Betaproteobacteria bacterium PRO3]
MPDQASAPPIAGLAPAAFLRSHWQKRSKLLRAAMPGFTGPFTRGDLVALACRDDVESRLVVRTRGSWLVEHGPFARRRFASLPARDWTLLVQGTNLVDERADALMRRFDFLPFARLDDVMVSYAAPGGGVGPHLDSYDVFLLQGFGRRRWRWGRQRDASFRPGLPLRILARFTPTHDEVLGPGDMLYLPPGDAHDGVAVEACTTYSIGFRAALSSEIAEAFLTRLAERVDLPGRYADPDLAPARSPARISRAMQDQVAQTLSRIRVARAEVDAFLGAWLTEPKAHVTFARPARPPSAPAFARTIARRGVRLDLGTQALYDGRTMYVNGESLSMNPIIRASLARLADRRGLAPREAAVLPREAIAVLHDWHRHGWLHVGSR